MNYLIELASKAKLLRRTRYTNKYGRRARYKKHPGAEYMEHMSSSPQYKYKVRASQTRGWDAPVGSPHTPDKHLATRGVKKKRVHQGYTSHLANRG